VRLYQEHGKKAISSRNGKISIGVLTRGAVLPGRSNCAQLFPLEPTGKEATGESPQGEEIMMWEDMEGKVSGTKRGKKDEGFL